MKKKSDPIFHILDLTLIFAFTIYVLLDTFIIPKAYAIVENNEDSNYGTVSETTTNSTSPVVTNTSYSDGNVSITILQYTYENTTIYVADVQLSSIDYLKSAFAQNTYGKNVTATTSAIASSNNAILAINGDYYGAQIDGYVNRNGTWYRTSTRSKEQEDLVIHQDGSFEIIQEGSTSADNITDVLQVYSFGPALIENGTISVSEQDEVGKAMASNPRTAICEIEPLHYLFVVADGRTSESEGLSLYELASFLQTLGVKTAYNLDGGGSSTMVFNGNVVNNPTTDGNQIKERSVSDIVYIGYE